VESLYLVEESILFFAVMEICEPFPKDGIRPWPPPPMTHRTCPICMKTEVEIVEIGISWKEVPFILVCFLAVWFILVLILEMDSYPELLEYINETYQRITTVLPSDRLCSRHFYPLPKGMLASFLLIDSFILTR
jgi:hypothetical protein